MAVIGKFLLSEPFYAAGSPPGSTRYHSETIDFKGGLSHSTRVKNCEKCQKPITQGDLCPECFSQQKLTEGEDYYLSAEGLLVFTEKYHLKRGYCCGNKCRHCPYNTWDKN